jgi:hypothetical protein
MGEDGDCKVWTSTASPRSGTKSVIPAPLSITAMRTNSPPTHRREMAGLQKMLFCNRLASFAAPHPHAVHPYPAASRDRAAHDHRASIPGAAGAVDATGAHHGIGVGRFEGHCRAEGEDGECKKQKRAQVDLPVLFLSIIV